MNRYTVKPLNIVFIGLITALLFIPFGGQVHLFDWDEINFAESAREMLVTGNYSQVTVNYEPFWEKPPLFIWMQALSMKVFGINEFAARFPNALAGIVTLCLIFFIGARHFRGHVGLGWTLAYAGSLFPHFYFNTGLIDPVFNLFIFINIYFLYKGLCDISQSKNFWFAGLFLGFAILTKGPVALLVSVLVILVLSFSKRNFYLLSLKNWFVYLFIAFVISSFWFVPEMIVNGPWFIKEFFQYQLELASQDVAGHAQPFYYHFFVLLIGCFPASVIAFSIIKDKSSYDKSEKLFKQLMVILFFVVLILFSIVKTKIVHYSSLCWLPLSFMAGLAYDGLFRKKVTFKTWQKGVLVFLSVVWTIAFSVLPIMGLFPKIKTLIASLIKDDFVLANMQVQVSWSLWDILPLFILISGVVYTFYFLYKNQNYKAIRTLLITNIVFLPLYAIIVVPKAEKHIQGSLISFYKSIANENAYVKSTEKSYAPYFYAQVKPPVKVDAWQKSKQRFISQLNKTDKKLNKEERDALETHQLDWLMNGPIDKTVYLVCKTHKAEFILNHPNFKLIDNKGGYSFFKREILSETSNIGFQNRF